MGIIKIRATESPITRKFEGNTSTKQQGVIESGSKYGLPITLRPNDESGYKEGTSYFLHGKSFEQGEFGLQLGRLVLTEQFEERAVIEILSDEVVKSDFEGKETFRQEAILVQDKKGNIGLPCRIPVDGMDKGYKAGFYDIDGSTLRLKQYGQPKLQGRLVLIPVNAQHTRPAPMEVKAAG